MTSWRKALRELEREQGAAVAAVIIRGKPSAVRAAIEWLRAGDLPVKVLSAHVRSANIYFMRITPELRADLKKLRRRQRRGGDNSGKAKLSTE